MIIKKIKNILYAIKLNYITMLKALNALNRRIVTGPFTTLLLNGESDPALSPEEKDGITAKEGDETNKGEIEPKKRAKGKPKGSTKPKAEKKSKKETGIEAFGEKENSKDKKIKPKSKKILRDEEDSKRELSAKKSRFKSKFKKAEELFRRCRDITVPKPFIETIRSCNLNILNLDKFQQEQCFNFLRKVTKEELTVSLMLVAKTSDEISFVKTSIFQDNFINLLFLNLDSDNMRS